MGCLGEKAVAGKGMGLGFGKEEELKNRGIGVLKDVSMLLHNLHSVCTCVCSFVVCPGFCISKWCEPVT